MAVYGIDQSTGGWVTKRLPEILADLQADVLANIVEVDLSPDTPDGELIGAVAKAAADIWERMEEVYWSQWRDTAEGISLDRANALVGVTRIEAAPSETVL